MKILIKIMILISGLLFCQNSFSQIKPKRIENTSAGFILQAGANGRYGHVDPTFLGFPSGTTTVHAPDTGVAPANAGAPTIGEMETWNAGANLDAVIYYTGTDAAGDPATYVFYSDSSGNITLIESPAQLNNFARRTVPGPAFANPAAPTEAEVLAFIDLLSPAPKPFTVFELLNGALPTNGDANNPEVAWLYDGVDVTRIKDFPRKVEIPSGAFANPNVPTIPEIGTWLIANPQTGNLHILYLAGSGSVDNPDYAWWVAGDTNLAQADVVLIKQPVASASIKPTNGLTIIAPDSTGLGGTLTQPTTAISGFNKNFQMNLTGTSSVNLNNTGNTHLFLNRSMGYLGILDGSNGLVQVEKPDTSVRLKGRYLHLEGLFNDGAMETRYYDLDGSNYVAFGSADTVAANAKWNWMTADGTAGQGIVTDGAGNLSFADVSDGVVTSGTFNGSAIDLALSTGGNVAIAGTILNTSSNATLANELAAYGDCSGGAVTFTLPSPSSAVGKKYEVAKTDLSGNPLILSGTFSTGTERLIYHNRLSSVASNGTFYFIN